MKKKIRGTWKKTLGAVCVGTVLGQCVWGAQVSAAGTAQQAAYEQQLAAQAAAQAAYEQQLALQQAAAQAAYEQQLAAQQALIQQEQLAAQKKAQEEHEAQLRAFQQALLSQQQAEAQARMTAAGYAVSALQPSDGRLIAAGLLNFAPETSLKGKTVSILGDSISTYQGYIPAKYACFYPDAVPYGNEASDERLLFSEYGMRQLPCGGFQRRLQQQAAFGAARRGRFCAGCDTGLYGRE